MYIFSNQTCIILEGSGLVARLARDLPIVLSGGPERDDRADYSASKRPHLLS